MFGHATAENALVVLEGTIPDRGKSVSIMTDRSSQFCANTSKTKKKGALEFAKRLINLRIPQILAGIRHPQTNGRLKRLHRGLQRKRSEFEATMMRKSDSVDLFMWWYNYERPHMWISRIM